MGLSDFFGELIADIRQKVVEEPWFGRAVTPQEVNDRSGDNLGWAAWRDADPAPHDAVEPSRDQGIGHELGER